MKPKFLVAITLLIFLIALLPAAGATKPAGPVTIETDIDFSSFPFGGTFDVTQGAAILGCSGGTFVDLPNGFGSIQKVFTCDVGGSFTFLFVPGRAPGPGDLNGHWQAFTGSGDFAGLRGQGDFSVVFTGPTSGEETLTGVVHFEP